MERINRKKRQRPQLFYSFLTLLLITGIIYMSASAFYYTVKAISFHMKISDIKELNQELSLAQQILLSDIERYESEEKCEAFLRNNLKYAAPDEIEILKIDSVLPVAPIPHHYY